MAASSVEAPRALRVDAPLAGRAGWRMWLGALAGLGLLAAAAWAFQTQVERWVLRATFRAVRDEEPKRIDDRFVGRWIAPDGRRLLIGRSAVVWFESGNLIGAGRFDVAEPARFLFEGPGFRCTYDLAVRRDVSDWHLLDGTPGTPCPQGRFVRTFAF